MENNESAGHHVHDEVPNSARGILSKKDDPSKSDSPNGLIQTAPSPSNKKKPKKSEFIAEKEKVNMCVTLFLLLPISFSGPCVSFLAYSFHLCGVFLGIILFTITSIICIYSSYLIVIHLNSIAEGIVGSRGQHVPWTRGEDHRPVHHDIYHDYSGVLSDWSVHLRLHLRTPLSHFRIRISQYST